MVGLRRFWNAFKAVAILLSFVINFILIIVLLVVLQQLFVIKTGIVQPLINGLHSSFVGLDEARIITTIKVQDTIPVKLDIPLQQNTVVTLTGDVPLRVAAAFTLADGTTLRGQVAITLPKDLQLPVALNLNVPVDSSLPITLNVPVDIPLNQSQLHDVADRLRGLFDPLVRLFGNLPDDWNGVIIQVGNALGGNPTDLWRGNKYTDDPWPGFKTGLYPPDPNAVPSVAAPVQPIGGTPGPTPTLITSGSGLGDLVQPPADGSVPVDPNAGNNNSNSGNNRSTTNPVAATPLPSGPTPTLTIIQGAGQPAAPTQVNDLGIITPTPAP